MAGRWWLASILSLRYNSSVLREVDVLNVAFGDIINIIIDSMVLVLNVVHLTTQSPSADSFIIL